MEEVWVEPGEEEKEEPEMAKTKEVRGGLQPERHGEAVLHSSIRHEPCLRDLPPGRGREGEVTRLCFRAPHERLRS